MSRELRVEGYDLTFVSLEFNLPPLFGHFRAKKDSLLAFLGLLLLDIHFSQLWVEFLLLLHVDFTLSDIEGI